MLSEKSTSNKGWFILAGVIIVIIFIYVNMVSGIASYNYTRIDNISVGNISTNITSNITEYYGYNLTGIDGTLNRTLYVGSEPSGIKVDGFALHNNTDYVTTVGNITFLNRKWNEQRIQIEI